MAQVIQHLVERHRARQSDEGLIIEQAHRVRDLSGTDTQQKMLDALAVTPALGDFYGAETSLVCQEKLVDFDAPDVATVTCIYKEYNTFVSVGGSVVNSTTQYGINPQDDTIVPLNVSYAGAQENQSVTQVAEVDKLVPTMVTRFQRREEYPLELEFVEGFPETFESPASLAKRIMGTVNSVDWKGSESITQLCIRVEGNRISQAFWDVVYEFQYAATYEQIVSWTDPTTGRLPPVIAGQPELQFGPNGGLAIYQIYKKLDFNVLAL